MTTDTNAPDVPPADAQMPSAAPRCVKVSDLIRALLITRVSLCPQTPPPSLVTDRSSTAKSYTRKILISLANPFSKPPTPERVNSFSDFIRRDSSDWGIPEDQSQILDGEPISKSLPIPRQVELVGVEGKGHPSDLLFSFNSSPGDQAVPILIDFNNPQPFGKASQAFQGFPGSVSSADTLISAGRANSLSREFNGIRLGSRTPSVSSRSNSPISFDNRSRGSSISRPNSLSGALNPFAVPFHHAQTPKVNIPSGRASPERWSPARKSSTVLGDDTVPSLPLPKALPPSLPKRPNSVLPPVFVKREAAALPQPMSLKDVAPLGQGWEGDRSLSGNEKRRRASVQV
jgi:hypothetical protein